MTSAPVDGKADSAAIDRSNLPAADDPRRCTAAARSTGVRCRNWAAVGLNVCRYHGAGTQAARHKRAEFIVDGQARNVLQRLGEPEPIAHPVEELLRLAAEVQAWRIIIRERVDQLQTYVATDALGVERERAVISLYERAMDRSARVLGELAKLDLGHRLVRVREAEAAAIVAVLEGAVRRLGLDPTDVDVRSALAAELEAAEPGVVP